MRPRGWPIGEPCRIRGRVLEVPPLPEIVRRAAGTKPRRAGKRDEPQWAAVAVVLREGARGAEVLLIERSRRPSDPWSGDLALPGGRRDPADPSLLDTARRETMEEVGLSLGAPAAVLDELDARAAARPFPLVVAPFLFVGDGAQRPRPNAEEVARAFFRPLAPLLDPDQRVRTRFSRGGRLVEAEAVAVAGHRLWGLTLRLLDDFARRIGVR